ncbi:hypothetical protein J7K93_13250 [bacterium]|nr:hypothetical protein [bacterium]
MTVSIGAIIASKKRRHIINTFREKGAVSQQEALSLENLGLSESLIFNIQKRKSVIVKTEEGLFYLDEKQKEKSDRYRISAIGIIIILTVLVIYLLSR